MLQVDTWYGHWLGGVGVHHGMTFTFGQIVFTCHIETCFSYDKDIWIAATDYCMYLHIIVLFPLVSYSPINKYCSFIIFSLIINAVNVFNSQ